MADTDPIARKGTLLDRLRAANANKPKPDLSHLDDPGLWKRIGLSEAVDVDDGEELEPVRSRSASGSRKSSASATSPAPSLDT